MGALVIAVGVQVIAEVTFASGPGTWATASPRPPPPAPGRARSRQPCPPPGAWARPCSPRFSWRALGLRRPRAALPRRGARHVGPGLAGTPGRPRPAATRPGQRRADHRLSHEDRHERERHDEWRDRAHAVGRQRQDRRREQQAVSVTSRGTRDRSADREPGGPRECQPAQGGWWDALCLEVGEVTAVVAEVGRRDENQRRDRARSRPVAAAMTSAQMSPG